MPQIAYVVGHNYRQAALGRILDIEGPELAIIFTRTRNEVDELTEGLRARGWSVEALHGGLDQPTRDRVMRRARAGQVDAIVATDVAARGIDLENLTPSSTTAFPPRTKRTCTASAVRAAPGAPGPRSRFWSRANTAICATSSASRRPASKSVRCRAPTTSPPRRLEQTKAAMTEILEAGELDRWRVIVEQLCEENDPFDVAAAALRLAEEAEGRTDDDTDIPAFAPFERRRNDRGERGERRNDRPRRERSSEPEPGMTRLFFGAGRDAGVRPADVVGAVANEAGINSRSIGAIDIAERFTIVEVERTRRTGGERPPGHPLQGPQRHGEARSAAPLRRPRRTFRTPRAREDREDRQDREERGARRFDRFDRFDRGDRNDRFNRGGRGPRR